MPPKNIFFELPARPLDNYLTILSPTTYDVCFKDFVSSIFCKLAREQKCHDDVFENAIIATFPGTALDEIVYADMVVEDTGAIPHYWEFNQSEGLSHFVDSLWSMEDVYGGIAVPIWCTYREVRRSGLVVTLDGHGADELLCGYPWTLDWHYGDMNNNLYNDFHVGVLPAILRNFDRYSMAHGVEILTPFLDYPLVCFLFG